MLCWASALSHNMATPEHVECIGCDAPVALSSLSAAARNARAGFCELCKDIEAEKVCLNQTYHLRDVPVLGDIDGDISQILVNSVEQSNECIALALSQNIPHDILRDTRYDLLCRAVANINEGRALRDQPLTGFKPSRRCGNADKCALDIVELFKFISCISSVLPTCLSSSKAIRSNLPPPPPPIPPPSYSAVMKSPRVSRYIADKIKAISRPCPEMSADTSSPPLTQSDASNMQAQQSSPPPPPPPPPSRSTSDLSSALLMEETSDESFRLFLNKTPGALSVSLGEATLGLYPCTPANPSHPPGTFKTPAELRCQRNDPPVTSSPMNTNAPPFVPQNQAAFSTATFAASNLTGSTTASMSHAPSGPTSDPVQTLPSPDSNWAQAQEFINAVNDILEKNPTYSTDLPINPNLPNVQPDTTPSDSGFHISSPIIAAMQAQIEWLITHVAGQDQRIIDLQTELDNFKQGAIRSHPDPAPPAPPRRPAPQANHTPAAPPPPTNTVIPPPGDFADASIPNVPVSNRFDCLTAEDVALGRTVLELYS